MGLPPIPGFNVITKPDGTQVYSRYTQADLYERNAQPEQAAVSTPQSAGKSYSQEKVIQGPKEPVISFGTPVSGTPPPATVKPTQEISSSTFQLIEARRKAAGEAPLSTVENVKIVSPTHYTPPPQKEALPNNTNDYSGLVEISSNIETKNGQTTTTTITPGIGETQTSKGVESKQTTYQRENDNTFKTLVASAVEIPAFIGLSFAALGANLTGKEVLGIKPGTPEQQQTQVTEKIQKSVGVTPLDLLTSGDIKSFSELPLEQKAAGLVGSGLGAYFSGGGNLKKDIGSLISKFVKTNTKTVPAVTEKITAPFVRQTPTYRATNPMREKIPTDIFSSDTVQSPTGSTKPNEPNNPLLENVAKETQKKLSSIQDNLLIPPKEKPTLPNQPVKEDKTYKPNLDEFRTMGKKINTDQVLNIEQPQIGDTKKFTSELKKNPNVKESSPNLGEVPLIAERYPLMSNESLKLAEKPISQDNISLGKGIGQMINKKGGGSPLDLSKPKPPTPPPKPEERSAGKGLIQIVKEEKPTLEPTKQKSTFKEYPIQLGEGKVNEVPKLEVKQETKTAGKVITKQKSGLLQSFQKKEQIQSFQSKQQLQSFSVLTSQKQKQTQKSKQLFKQTQKELFKQTQKPSQKQSQVFEEPKLFKQTQKQPQLFKQEQTQVSKQLTKQTQKQEQRTTEKPPKGPPLLLIPGQPRQNKPHKHKHKKKKNYLGNAPVSAFIGLYARDEVTYNKKTISKLIHRSLKASKKGKDETGFSIAKRIRI